MTRSEHDDFPAFLHAFEEGDSIRTDVDAHIEGEAVDVDGQGEVGSGLVFLKAVNDGLIEV